MKAPLLIALAVVLAAGSGLAIMNKACKSSHHAWVRFGVQHPTPREAQLIVGGPKLPELMPCFRRRTLASSSRPTRI
jgi:hypothetical protein